MESTGEFNRNVASELCELSVASAYLASSGRTFDLDLKHELSALNAQLDGDELPFLVL